MENDTFNLEAINKPRVSEIFPSLTKAVEENLTDFVAQICASETIVQEKLAFVYSLRGNLGESGTYWISLKAHYFPYFSRLGPTDYHNICWILER
jgi:hypothetical protein